MAELCTNQKPRSTTEKIALKHQGVKAAKRKDETPTGKVPGFREEAKLLGTLWSYSHKQELPLGNVTFQGDRSCVVQQAALPGRWSEKPVARSHV